jgi:predicted deacylase
MNNEFITIGDTTIGPGERKRLQLPVARLATETWMSLPVEVVSGERSGVRLWLSAAVHGDEINGVEIIRHVLDAVDEKKLSGSIIAVPIVNVFGFINQSRYLPDRRDLNRCFPGSSKGSLASRLADLFMTEIVSRCSHGIDLHTGSNYRANMPQVRGNLKDRETRRLAESFGAPVLMHSKTIAGSLRQAAVKQGKIVVLYEAGEPLRLDHDAIALGVKGVLRVMSELGMWKAPPKPSRGRTVEVGKTSWVRAPRSGIARLEVRLGDTVTAKQSIAQISDAFGDESITVKAPFDGLVIGHSNNPLMHQGDALVQVAQTLE